VASGKNRMGKILSEASRKIVARTGTAPSDFAAPDGFYQAPLTVTQTISSLKWSTAPLGEDVEVTGPAALTFHASIDTDDTNFIVKLYDVDPQGKRTQMTTGWLKASHRELDKSQSKPWFPCHPTRDPFPLLLAR